MKTQDIIFKNQGGIFHIFTFILRNTIEFAPMHA